MSEQPPTQTTRPSHTTPLPPQQSRGDGGGGGGSVEPAHERLHRMGSSSLRRSLDEQASWNRVVADRLSGKVRC